MRQYLYFITAHYSFLLPLENVFRIARWHPPCPTPTLPSYISGIVHFEGTLWVAINLDAIVGHNDKQTSEQYVLTKHNEYHLAFLAKNAIDVITVPTDKREKRSLSGFPEGCIEFVTVVRKDIAYCLNLKAFIKEFSVK